MFLRNPKNGIINSGEIRPESVNTCYRNVTDWTVSRQAGGRQKFGSLARRDVPRTVIARFQTKYKTGDGCWLWQAATFAKGYGMVNLGRDSHGKQHTEYAHRVAYVIAKGNIPEGLVVRHSCDTPACVNPDHLVLGTQNDNIQDAHRQGKYNRPRKVGSVRWIREQRRNGAWPKRGKPQAA